MKKNMQETGEIMGQDENREETGEKTIEMGTRQEAGQEGKEREEEFITFELFRDQDKYRGDKFVGVNGKSYLIKRGVPARMPRAVYEVLKNSNEQLMCAEKYMEKAKNMEIKVD